MTAILYSHPLSSYCQKALVALYEKDIAFETRLLDGEAPAAELARLWPLGKFPVLVDGDRMIPEASIIIEYLELSHPEHERLIPADPEAAIEVRMLDRFSDNYIMTPMQKIVADAIREEDARDRQGVEEARVLLDKAYAWLDARMAQRTWAAGETFSLADCAAAPALLYADWSHAIPEGFSNLRAYRARLLARPSYARALDEARPYRHLFPLGAPTDRD